MQSPGTSQPGSASSALSCRSCLGDVLIDPVVLNSPFLAKVALLEWANTKRKVFHVIEQPSSSAMFKLPFFHSLRHSLSLTMVHVVLFLRKLHSLLVPRRLFFGLSVNRYSLSALLSAYVRTQENVTTYVRTPSPQPPPPSLLPSPPLARPVSTVRTCSLPVLLRTYF